MKFGSLDFISIDNGFDLVGKPTSSSIQEHKLEGILVSEIDSSVSDTAAFCEKYDISPETCVNCVVIEAKRGDRVWYAACLIPANKRADVNGIIRKELNAKKVSFAPMDRATSLTNMEFGAINPIGLPADWPILVETIATKLDYAIIGSGLRSSKLLIPGSLFSELPHAKIMSLAKE